MALIKCKECNTEISDKAATCPKCGAPITSLKENSAAGANLKTIQETSKKFKMQTLLSIFISITGITMLASAPEAEAGQTQINVGLMVTIIGLTWYIVNRFRIWWHHK